MSKTVMNTMSAATKLSEAQMSMLNAAAQREDRCLMPAPALRGAQVVKAGEKLISAGFAREVKAKGSWPVWRRDSETGAAFALKLTAVGAKAIVRGGEALSKEAAAEKPSAPLTTASPGTEAAAALATMALPTTTQESTAPPSIERTEREEPRPTSKIAAVIGLLSRSGGATLAELIAATGWLPHTTRAALTGLRKRGYALTLDRSDRIRGSTYFIDAKPPGGAVAGTETAAEAA